MKFIKVIKADEKEQHYWEHPNYENWKKQKKVAEEKILQEAYNHLDELYSIINKKIGMDLTYKADITEIRGKNYIEFESDDFSKAQGLLSIIFKKLILSGDFSAGTERRQDNYDEYDVSVEPKCYAGGSISFRFDIHSGGSNGIDLCRAWYQNGKWEVRFSSDIKSNW